MVSSCGHTPQCKERLLGQGRVHQPDSFRRDVDVERRAVQLGLDGEIILRPEIVRLTLGPPCKHRPDCFLNWDLSDIQGVEGLIQPKNYTESVGNDAYATAPLGILVKVVSAWTGMGRLSYQ